MDKAEVERKIKKLTKIMDESMESVRCLDILTRNNLNQIKLLEVENVNSAYSKLNYLKKYGNAKEAVEELQFEREKND